LVITFLILFLEKFWMWLVVVLGENWLTVRMPGIFNHSSHGNLLEQHQGHKP